MLELASLDCNTIFTVWEGATPALPQHEQQLSEQMSCSPQQLPALNDVYFILNIEILYYYDRQCTTWVYQLLEQDRVSHRILKSLGM